MWTVIVERVAEFALALISAIKSIATAVSQWQAVALGETKGRAEADSEYADSSRRADEAMQAIAEKPSARDEIIKRLEEGSA